MYYRLSHWPANQKHGLVTQPEGKLWFNTVRARERSVSSFSIGKLTLLILPQSARLHHIHCKYLQTEMKTLVSIHTLTISIFFFII